MRKLILSALLLVATSGSLFAQKNLEDIQEKISKKKYGEGRRIFLMSLLHHHYQKKGYHEAKIVTRFWIITILCAVLSIVTLKIR